MQVLCNKYNIRQATVERLLEAEDSKRDLRRRRGLADLLRRIIEEEAESKETRSATPKD